MGTVDCQQYHFKSLATGQIGNVLILTVFLLKYYIGDKGEQSGLSWQLKFGHIGAFDQDQEDCKSYSECLGHYLSTNKINDAIQKHDVLLSTCGPTTYTLVWNLTTPSPPAELSYQQNNLITSRQLQPKTISTSAAFPV